MIVSKVKIELRFKRRVPKSVLEHAVERFAEMEKQLVKPYKKHDPNAHVRVWYEDRAGTEGVHVVDMLPSNPFKRIFRKRGDKKCLAT